MRFKFDQFVIDGDRRMVWRGDEEMHVAPKTLDFLVAAADPGAERRVKDGIDDNAVARHARLRRDADRRGGRRAGGAWRRWPGADAMIRTMHRFGYAFTAQIEREAGGNSAEPVLGMADRGRLAAAAPIRERTILGREGDGVVPLPSPSVSRQHAALIMEGSAARLRDLGSKNGTFVDDLRVEGPVALRDGARCGSGPSK